ncbi:MAG TPA: DUF2723 domain-containing protein [Candidatus Sphingobacterium stercoripullorum]|nr:DUF2723 domain-containing protein [Candidatus Sphingobacterium stercoripullorum]
MRYNRINNLVGWACALIATLTYVLTAERTLSWWDTGEFIASAYKMQIVHQPGAPLFLMIQNVFSNFALGNTEQIAFWMNVGSAVCSGITILFLFWSITALARKIFVGYSSEDNLTLGQLIAIMGAGTVGSLAYTYTDTFWFSAVESEVYAMSSLCTAAVFWAILKWERRADEPTGDRWLLLIAYIMGLSIGVHLLNLLVIPAIALIIYFRRTSKVTKGGIAKALGIGVLVLGFILWGVIQYTIKLAAYFDLFFVNSLGLGFGSGVLFFAVLLVGLIVYLIYYSIKKAKPLLNIIMLSLTLILFGYSSFSMILIRAKADTSLNNSDPDNAFSFLRYLNREQYASNPLIKGRYFDSEVVDVKEGGKVYRKDKEKYEVARKRIDYKFDRETLFPRVHSERGEHVQFYRDFLGLGPNEKPSMVDNIKFFLGYQLGHMYGRYFMWNFVGRQNQQQGLGSLTEGNWLSGIKPIDSFVLGSQDKLPESERTNPGRNTYFFLPLILGLVGVLWHFKKTRKDAWVVTLLFFFTGAAIVLYLNDTPMQPRERDYVYAGSFYAFCIWIGLAVLALWEWFSKKMNAKNAALVATAICLITGPVLLAKENWVDHDRSEKFLARDMAKNYLNSCAPNAILFTYGDNDTYPLWYVQEVEGYRTDVRVVNLSLLGSDWYMKQMMNKVNDADALPFNIDPEKIKDGVRDVIYYVDHNIDRHVDIEDLLTIMLSDNRQNMVQLQSGEYANVLPTKKMQFKVNKSDVLSNQVVPEKWNDYITDTMTWEFSGNVITRAELSILSILANNNWERPVYFTITTPETNYIGLDRYLVSEGFALRLMPVDLGLEEGEPSTLVNTEATYKNIMENYQWGNIADAKYLDPDSYRYFSLFAGSVFGQTAQNLILEGNNQGAKSVVEEAHKSLPDKTYTIGEAAGYAVLIDAAYKAGAVDLGREMGLRNLKYVKDNMEYYFDITGMRPEMELRNIQIGLSAVMRYYNIAQNNENVDEEFTKEAEALFEQYKMYLME